MVKCKCKYCNEEFEAESNVFTISRSENFCNARFMPFDIEEPSMYYLERLQILDDRVEKLENPFIVAVKRFNNFKEGWDYVVANNSEGLVLRNNSEWLKCKILKEEKVEIVAHEEGKDKGTFILKDGNRVSGTSQQFVLQYLDIKQRGKTPMLEVEYAFRTETNKMFQPRARRIFEVENE